MDNVLLVTSIAAVTEFLKRLKASDWYGAAVIACAALIGALLGVFNVQGISVVDGLIAGLGIAGIHTIARQVG